MKRCSLFFSIFLSLATIDTAKAWDGPWGQPINGASNLGASGYPVGFLSHLASSSIYLTSSSLTSCGTSPSINNTATDSKGTITEGATATGCVLTFSSTYQTAPDCSISSPTGQLPTNYSTTTTALTIVNVSATGDKFTYYCVQ